MSILVSSASAPLLALLGFPPKRIMTQLPPFSSAIHPDTHLAPPPKHFPFCSFLIRLSSISPYAPPHNLTNDWGSGSSRKISPPHPFLFLALLSLPLYCALLTSLLSSPSPAPHPVFFVHSLTQTAKNKALSHFMPSPCPYLSDFASHV